MTLPVLHVANLSVGFPTRRGTLVAVDNISFVIKPGEVLGIVGESGAGKSLTAAAISGLLVSGRISNGEIRLNGRRIDCLSEDELRRLRGKEIGIIFQESIAALDPLFRIGEQIIETIRTHADVSAQDARLRALELLQLVGITAPRYRMDQYPHELSGGMRQRIAIALAVCANPRLLIADEPTTGLDVSVQAQIVAVLRALLRTHRTAVMMISHDLGVLSEFADRIAVMYAGRVVEVGSVRNIINNPMHPYTEGLIGSIPSLRKTTVRLPQIEGIMPPLDGIPIGCAFSPRCRWAFDRCTRQRPELFRTGETESACWLYCDSRALPVVRCKLGVQEPLFRAKEELARPLVVLRKVSRCFDVSATWLNRMFDRQAQRVLWAVAGVTLEIRRGETFALVGESGCGKSTLARLIVGLDLPTSGSIEFDGVRIEDLRTHSDWAPLRPRIQMIFQDPSASLDPRWRVGDIIAEPIRTHGLAKGEVLRRRVVELLLQVGMSPADATKYPQALSSGQRQRISIARALATRPELLVCDEPTSALDVSVQAQILNLLSDFQRTYGLTYLFISHNLLVVRHLSHRVAVMYLGRILELASTHRLFSSPQHPYTRMLLDAIPDPLSVRAAREPVKGEVPNPLVPPPGCAFHPRCAWATDRCRREIPVLKPTATSGIVACHGVEEGRLTARS